MYIYSDNLINDSFEQINKTYPTRKPSPPIPCTPLGHASWLRTLSALASHVHILVCVVCSGQESVVSVQARPQALAADAELAKIWEKLQASKREMYKANIVVT